MLLVYYAAVTQGESNSLVMNKPAVRICPLAPQNPYIFLLKTKNVEILSLRIKSNIILC